MAPLKFKRALRSAARLPARVSASRSSSARTAFAPLPNELPLVLLRIQVLGCSALIAKDRNDFSDPFVVVSVLKRTVNPIYTPKDATWDFPLYLSLADRLGAVELVVWDKDMVGKDYLGEVAIPLDEWWGEEGRGYGWDGPANKVRAGDRPRGVRGVVGSDLRVIAVHVEPGEHAREYNGHRLHIKLGFVRPDFGEHRWSLLLWCVHTRAYIVLY